jgi:hypothetical protein
MIVGDEDAHGFAQNTFPRGARARALLRTIARSPGKVTRHAQGLQAQRSTLSSRQGRETSVARAEMMRNLALGACLYAVSVFAIGFALGAARVLAIAPLTGPTLGVLIELPFILTASWFVAGWVARRFPISGAGAAWVATGAVAFVVLQALEFGLALALFGLSPRGFLAQFATAPGALGLAGQIAFAALPAVRAAIPPLRASARARRRAGRR